MKSLLFTILLMAVCSNGMAQGSSANSGADSKPLVCATDAGGKDAKGDCSAEPENNNSPCQPFEGGPRGETLGERFETQVNDAGRAYKEDCYGSAGKHALGAAKTATDAAYEAARATGKALKEAYTKTFNTETKKNGFGKRNSFSWSTGK